MIWKILEFLAFHLQMWLRVNNTLVTNARWRKASRLSTLKKRAAQALPFLHRNRFSKKFSLLVSMLTPYRPPSISSEGRYHLQPNDYPGDQDGGTLSGHITVVDTAAADGLLDPSETSTGDSPCHTPQTLPTLTVDSLTASNPSLSMSVLPSTH